MTSKQLHKLTALWQKRLRLQDWTLTVEFEDSLQKNDIMGTTELSPTFLEAIIRVNPNQDDDGVEITIVHELMHVRFPNHTENYHGMFTRTSLIGNEFEVGIEVVSRALREAYKDA